MRISFGWWKSRYEKWDMSDVRTKQAISGYQILLLIRWFLLEIMHLQIFEFLSWLIQLMFARIQCYLIRSFCLLRFDTIKSISLSLQLLADKLIWAEPLFNVRSAYKVALELSTASSSSSSLDDSNLKRFWKHIWKIRVPYKVCHFVWKACRDILPTKQNLKHRQVLSEDLWAESNLDLETIGHLFWSCLRAQRVWTYFRIFQSSFVGLFHAFLDLLWRLMMIDDCEQDSIAFMVTIARSIWGNCNAVRNGGKRKVKWSWNMGREFFCRNILLQIWFLLSQARI